MYKRLRQGFQAPLPKVPRHPHTCAPETRDPKTHDPKTRDPETRVPETYAPETCDPASRWGGRPRGK